jgi:hypothetical protein
MRPRIPFILVFSAVIVTAILQAQVTDPLPAPVEKRGLMVEIKDVVRLPDTRGGWLGARAIRPRPA